MNTDTDQTSPKLRSGEDNSYSEISPWHGTSHQTPRVECHGDNIRAELHGNDTTTEFHGLDINLHPDQAVVDDLYGDEVGRLTLRVRELENIIGNQNRELLGRETLERNYRACLEELARYKTECSVLENDRDTQYNERSFYQLQAAQLTSENNKLRERIQEKNSLLLETEGIKVHQSSQIKELQDQLRALTERFTDDAETGFRHEIVRRRESQNVVTFDSVINSEPIPQKRRFSTTQSDHPVCKNCKTVFCNLRPVDVYCTFHIAPPQPYEVWRSNLVDPMSSVVTKTRKSYKFWPCCEQVSIKEPPGCRRLPKHELIQ